MNARLECKDIADDVFLAAVEQTEPLARSWRMSWAVRKTLEGLIGEPVPDKLLIAKARKLIDRGLLHGCPCGCRGDFHLPAADGKCC
jgi:hypothetical protein